MCVHILLACHLPPLDNAVNTQALSQLCMRRACVRLLAAKGGVWGLARHKAAQKAPKLPAC